MEINTMKNALIILFTLIVTSSFAQQHQTNLESEINVGDGFTLTTFLKVEQTNDQFIITSPKNADVRLFGGFKARLGRIFGKSPQKGIFVTIDSKQNGDSLLGAMKIPMLGKLKFKGIYNNGLLNGEMIKNDTILVGNIRGKESQRRSIDYSYLFPKIIEITENNIYSKTVLQTDEWKKFQKQLKKTLNNVQDDIELFFGFNLLSLKLPFSHYNLILQETTEEEENSSAENLEKKEATVIYEKKNESTAYLKIANFSSSTKELADVLPKIIKENPKNLIIDLRDNGGGGIEAAFEFGKYIMDNSIEIGYFVTNKLQYTGFDIDLFKDLSVAEPQTTDEFIETLKHGKGAKLVFNNPDTPVFLGNIFILTNGGTASTCEPIVYVLKESKRATIIGEKTAGAMLSATYFDISGKYKLVLPIADFYTYDGVRLDGVGVSPNIETTSENALDKALSLINQPL
jgi:peptidase S41-like protein